MLIEQVDAPALLVGPSQLDPNVATFAKMARDPGASLRPQVKTHTTIGIARWQLAAGSPGIAVAKSDLKSTPPCRYWSASRPASSGSTP